MLHWVAIPPFSVVKIPKVPNRVKTAANLDTYQGVSIKLLALECWVYLLAVRLSVPNWLFWAQPSDSQGGRDYEHGRWTSVDQGDLR